MRDQTPHAPCVVCGAPMAPGRRDWLWRCAACGFLASTLTVRVNTSASAIDEPTRAAALHALRRRNFERVLDAMAGAGLAPGARVLDVGCGHGWFVRAASARGYAAAGLEPDEAIAADARRDGAAVRSGFFPDALGPGERFDAIVFNDVFEHLPDPPGALRAVRDRLSASGQLIVNLPVATGIFYRVACRLDRVGIGGPFGRMWQQAFPSPHLSYFTQAQLARLAARCGFVERLRATLPSLESAGLWARLRYDRTASPIGAAAMWIALRAVLPILAALPADIGLQIFAAAPTATARE
jgi:SAM-dependent methyltransferase